MKLFSSIDGNDLLITLGFVALSAGLSMVSVPLMLIVVGGLALVIGLAGAWRKGGK